MAVSWTMGNWLDGVMGEVWRHLLLRRRQRHPHLQTVQAVALGAALAVGALGVDDAAAGGQPLTAPGRIGTALPRLSRCMISPSNR